MSNLDEVRDDLRDEHDAFNTLLAGVDDALWREPTPSPGWTVGDQVGHLAFFDHAAALAITNSGAEELLVKPVSPKALYEHIAHIVLRHDEIYAPTSFLQNQRRHTQTQRKKANDPNRDTAFVE